MPRLRGSWVALAGVLWCATTLADTITVTTTNPDLWDKADNECSLFEAVSYFNRDKPADGFQGCKKPKDDISSDTIELPETKGSAVLAAQGSPLELQVLLTINGRGFAELDTHTTLVAPNAGPLFRITGRDCKFGQKKVHKAAVVDDPGTTEVDETKAERDVCETDNGDGTTTPLSPEVPAVHASAILTLNQTRVDGCGTTTSPCAINGGAIRIEEGGLAVDHVTFLGGVTMDDTGTVEITGLGGAVYVADGAAASFTSAIFRDNRAADGAAIYAANMRLTLRQSSIYDNQVTAAGGAIVRVAAGTTTAVAGSIENVTFSRNPAGTALRLTNSHAVNHLTVVDNNTAGGVFSAQAGGLVLDAGTLTLNNSIVAGNGGVDCAGTITASYSLFTSERGCPVTTGTDGVQSRSFATPGTCDAALPLLLANKSDYDTNATASALNPGSTRFCSVLTPLLDPARNGFLLHRPLMALRPWSDFVLAGEVGYRTYSHVIDRANIAASSSSCASTDQRGDTRSDCDLGAIEFKFSANKTLELTEHPAADTALAGKKIYQGETVVMALGDAIGDAELMPNCDINQDGTPEVTSDFPGVAGCPGFPRDPNTGQVMGRPTKGSISFNTDGNLVYTPSGSGFHGADTFVLRIYTTSSRFQDERRFVEVTYTIRADTRGGWQNSSLGGSVSWHWLLLGVLAVWRKKKN